MGLLHSVDIPSTLHSLSVWTQEVARRFPSVPVKEAETCGIVKALLLVIGLTTGSVLLVYGTYVPVLIFLGDWKRDLTCDTKES
ncbi:hypothetical protein U1Q18_027028 [Sarracenia purpurea var. burkii]